MPSNHEFEFERSEQVYFVGDPTFNIGQVTARMDGPGGNKYEVVWTVEGKPRRNWFTEDKLQHIV